MLFSVVIPTRHRNDLLAKCLDRLAPGSQTTTAAYEVIVSDDGSDSTAEAMIQQQYAWAKWVAGPRQGPAANRNNGASYAQGDWLVFTDDDCIPALNWLETYAQAIATSTDILAFEGTIQPIGNVEQDAARCPVNLTGGHFWSANVVVQKDLFNRINGFDPTYPLAAHEDQDLMIRLKLHTEIKFIETAKIEHPVKILPLSKTIADIPKTCRAWAHHINKNKQYLGYTTQLGIVRIGYLSQLSGLKQNLAKSHYKNAITNILTIAIGMPFAIAYLIQAKS